MKKKKGLLLLVAVLLIFNCSAVYADNGEEPGFLEKKITDFIVSISDKAFYYLAKNGLSIDAMVHNTDTVKVPKIDSYGISNDYEEVENKLKFSFDEDNYYGQISRPIYRVVRSIGLMGMFCLTYIMGLRLVKSNSGSKRITAKSAIEDYVLSMLLIVCMPEILSIANMLVSMITSGINVGSDVIGLGFVGEFRQAALDNGDFWNGVIYFGSVALTLWFGIVYLYRNLILIFLFMFFPIFGLFLNGENTKRIINGWAWETVSHLTVPLIDSLLLLAVTGLINLGLNGLIALIATACIIPLRGKFRCMLGLSAGRAEMVGFATLSGVAGLATRGIGGLKRGIGGIVSGVGDVKAANTFDREFNYAKVGYSATSVDAEESGNVGSIRNVGSSYKVPNFNIHPGIIQGRKLEMPAKVPTYSDENILSYNLRRQGYSKIAKATVGMVGGLTGGAVGAAAMSLLGPTPTVYGARIGGEFGSFIGEGLGAAGGLGIHDMFYDSIRARQVQRNTEEMQQITSLPANIQTDTQPVNYKFDANVDVNNLDSVTVDFAPINEITNAGSNMGTLPKGYDPETFDNDISSMLSEEIEKEIRNKAFNNTIQLTGINPSELQIQHNTIAGNYYKEKISDYSKNGVTITPEIEVSLRNEANIYANNALEVDKKLDLFKRVGQAEYRQQAIGVLYEQLKSNGYSPSMLDSYQDWVKKDIANMLKNDLYNSMDNNYPIMSVDDII